MPGCCGKVVFLVGWVTYCSGEHFWWTTTTAWSRVPDQVRSWTLELVSDHTMDQAPAPVTNFNFRFSPFDSGKFRLFLGVISHCIITEEVSHLKTLWKHPYLYGRTLKSTDIANEHACTQQTAPLECEAERQPNIRAYGSSNSHGIVQRLGGKLKINCFTESTSSATYKRRLLRSLNFTKMRAFKGLVHVVWCSSENMDFLITYNMDLEVCPGEVRHQYQCNTTDRCVRLHKIRDGVDFFEDLILLHVEVPMERNLKMLILG